MDYMDGGPDGMNPYPPQGYMHMNYMRNKATSSVVYQQKPMSPENLYLMGESSNSSNCPHPLDGGANPFPILGIPITAVELTVGITVIPHMCILMGVLATSFPVKVAASTTFVAESFDLGLHKLVRKHREFS
ncbi:hypothetical protein RchiOBHm_Chr4g0398621 [Rosa chinensis]|uniref:Uncharacterized protein n=1 Tax=Rosa chinensis TaxID=74649 RepID=A0A2P6QSC6_ROSCH|nr:hypothetical protein RchiOBHm_Chr4g0398621 [Rosa chinensis]